MLALASFDTLIYVLLVNIQFSLIVNLVINSCTCISFIEYSLLKYIDLNFKVYEYFIMTASLIVVPM